MKVNFRFQHWVLAITMGLVLVLTGLFLITVFSKFKAMSEQDAKARFSLIALHASAEITNLTKGVGRSVTAQSSAAPVFFAQNGKINQNELVSAFMASLASDANIYSHYFGLDNNEFLQVIGVRANQKIVHALNTPAETYFAVRRITREATGKRTERWQFTDRSGAPLGERTADAAYAPAERPWYAGAIKSGGLAVTEPYVFTSSGELGLTASAPLPGKIGVFGTDISLGTLNEFLAGLPMTPNAAILMLDENNRILAFNGRGHHYDGLNIAPLTALDAVEHPLFKAFNQHDLVNGSLISRLDLNGAEQAFVLSRQLTGGVAATRFKVIALAPMADFTGLVEQARDEVLLASGAILLLLTPLALLGSRRVVNGFAQLARNSESLRRLDFTVAPEPPMSVIYEINTLGDAQVVMHRSIKERTAELNLAQEKLAKLVENGLLLAKEHDRGKLLKHILFGSRDIANCAACTLFLRTEHDTLRFAMRTNDDKLPDFEVPLYDADTGEAMTGFVSSYVALKNEMVIIDDVYSETRFDLSGTKHFSELTGFRTVSMLTVPLSPHAGEVIGVLQLLNALDRETGAVIPFPEELISFVKAMAAQSAIALENQNLLASQEELTDSMIKILAGAIDAKSAYTGGHCERVPQLAVMLAEEAVKVDQGPLADFSFKNEDEWREFRIGAWLHDCGKVTTPEYVIDKASKLETIYNRIHEVRMRFEVLLRDAQIGRLEAMAAGMPEADADLRYAGQKQQLTDDFAFIAECNIGSESMAPELIGRIREIGSQSWLRHFDDRLGLSHGELQRHENMPAAALPARETLLADQPWHIIARTEAQKLDPKYGFQVKVPEHLYNFGELYNLAITRGTLTEEERFKINEHIIQTIVMLDTMHFPKKFKRVPEYAGTHHETLIGTGYPRKLTQEQLSIPARIMAIADIFEALTASDRPYKKAKTLSESVRILSSFKKKQHIDADLFDLFLTSGVYKRYGERFLDAGQIDEVDISQFIN